jgi:hypothetical protein
MAAVEINLYGFLTCGVVGSRLRQAQGTSAPSIQDSYLTMLYFCVIRMSFILNTRANKAGNIVQRNVEARSCNYCCGGKAINTTYSEYVSVALVIQHAKRIRRSILSSVVCLNLPYFSAFSKKRYEFWKKKIQNTKCVC